MSDWTWEYVPDAPSIVGGLTQAQVDEVESLASRIADAVAVRRIGTSFDVRELVSNVKSYGEGPVMSGFLTITGTMSSSWCESSTSGRLIRQAERVRGHA